MSKFRKKPVVIEAWQASADLGSAPPWLTERFGRDIQTNGGLMPFYIKTLEGVMAADDGDWIIKGVKGEIYPCKPDIFAVTYDQVDETNPHLINGDFQSDKYPTTPLGKVPLSTKDPMAQDLLAEYARRRRAVDADFADAVVAALAGHGYDLAAPAPNTRAAAIAECIQAVGMSAWKHVGQDAHSRGMDAGARHQLSASLEALDALKAPDADKLPCDVRVAPATVIRKGCPISTLMFAISRRQGWPDKDTTFERDDEIPAFLRPQAKA